VELYAERPGEAAAFYAWLLGPVSGGSPMSWQPVSLLFEHAVCGIREVNPQGPPASWVAVVAVPGLEAARDRALTEGFRVVDFQGRCYMVDDHGVWTRLVDADHIPVDIDPDALGNTIAEINVPTPRASAEAYARVLGLDVIEMVDDIVEYYMLLEDSVLTLGSLAYDSELNPPVGPTWLVYFDVPELELTVERAEDVDVRVALPPVKEDFNLHSVLIDPFGTPFGFCTYFNVEHSSARVRRLDGEMQLFSDAVRLLIDPRD
jgi:predicted enzyme related to lactoylglutathione lyase